MLVFCNDTATTEIYTLALHDALPIFVRLPAEDAGQGRVPDADDAVGVEHDDPERRGLDQGGQRLVGPRSEEHTSELQSRQYLVCRLLLEKKNPLPAERKRTPLTTSPA